MLLKLKELNIDLTPHSYLLQWFSTFHGLWLSSRDS